MSAEKTKGNCEVARIQGTRFDVSEEATASTNHKRKMPDAWSFMSSPTLKDVSGGRKVLRALDAPKKVFDNIIVLDFEWTCDSNKFGPSEIIEFPSVLLSGHPPYYSLIYSFSYQETSSDIPSL